MRSKWFARLAVAAATGGAIVMTTAHVAASTCPSPGTGEPGALNMLADATMLTIPMQRNAPQGNAGMNTAVNNTTC